jgi:hypothetical protein
VNTFTAALAGGAIGTILTWLARVVVVGQEIKANERALRTLDNHLETWVADETVRLRRALRAITSEMSARGLLTSGEHGYQVALAKEAALQAYRDQERTARTRAADILASEWRFHRLARTLFYRDYSPELLAPARVLQSSRHGPLRWSATSDLRTTHFLSIAIRATEASNRRWKT